MYLISLTFLYYRAESGSPPAGGTGRQRVLKRLIYLYFNKDFCRWLVDKWGWEGGYKKRELNTGKTKIRG
jgi:hypothetical protein